MKKTFRTRKLMKSVVLSLALAAVGFAGAAFAAPADANAAAVMASQMKNSSITELTNDTRVFKVDKKIQTKMVVSKTGTASKLPVTCTCRNILMRTKNTVPLYSAGPSAQ